MLDVDPRLVLHISDPSPSSVRKLIYWAQAELYMESFLFFFSGQHLNQSRRQATGLREPNWYNLARSRIRRT